MLIRKNPSLVYWLGNSLYLNITNKCSNNCFFCIRNFSSGVGGFNLKLEREPAILEVISELREFMNRRRWDEIVFCGFGEPLERLDCVLEVTGWIRKHYGSAVSVRIDTNGHGDLLNRGRDLVNELKVVGINKISVSLNAQDKETYNRVCRPKFDNAFESVLEFVEKAIRNFEIEITAVAVPEINIPKIREIAQRMGVKLRVREYIPCFW